MGFFFFSVPASGGYYIILSINRIKFHFVIPFTFV